MAFPLSNHLLFTPKPSKTLALHPPHPSKPILGFRLSTSSPILRRSFKPFLALQDSTPYTNNEEEGSRYDVKTSKSEADQKPLSVLKSLIKAYKDAVLDGDENAVSEIEAMIDTIESEKAELAQKVSALSAEITSGKEKYIRLQADFDNFRKRSEKERLTVRTDAQGEVVESLLPMIDNFERAKQQIKPETEKEKKIDTSYQGIYKQFVEIMRSFHVAAVATVGKAFDPALHEAIAREESQEFKEGIIIQEIRRGFLLGDRLLRPAMVKVSTGPGRKKTSAVADKSTGQPATAAGVDER